MGNTVRTVFPTRERGLMAKTSPCRGDDSGSTPDARSHPHLPHGEFRGTDSETDWRVVNC